VFFCSWRAFGRRCDVSSAYSAGGPDRTGRVWTGWKAGTQAVYAGKVDALADRRDIESKEVCNGAEH